MKVAASGHTIINNLGGDVLNGGPGNVVLEGRGGADVLNKPYRQIAPAARDNVAGIRLQSG